MAEERPQVLSHLQQVKNKKKVVKMKNYKRNRSRIIVYDYNEAGEAAVPSYIHERMINMCGPNWPR